MVMASTMPFLTEMSIVMVLAMLLKFPSVGKGDEVLGERDGPSSVVVGLSGESSLRRGGRMDDR